MENKLHDYLHSLSFGPMQNFDRMAVVPLTGSPNGPAYLTLTEAMQRHLIVVSEASEGGSVPELRVENRANQSVLLIDGEELVGAKQNRVVNTTILLKKQSVTIVPVSCTEAGRWSYDSPVFGDSGHVMSPHLRSCKVETVSDSLASDRQFHSDQGKVWAEIDRLHKRAGTTSATRAMRDVHEARRTSLEQYEAAFPIDPLQTGILVFIDGDIVGFDAVSRPQAFAVLAPKLIRSYALEAVIGNPVKGKKPSLAAAEGFVATAAEASQKKYKSVGHGQDFRFAGPRLVGSALVYRKQVIHTVFFSSTDTVETPLLMRSNWRARRRRRDDEGIVY